MIKLKQVVFRYKDMRMQFDLHVRPREKIAVVGASGAGKSTLLNLIAGFELPESGEIWLNGENQTYREPHQRPVSILFQENNVFPHLTVAQNITLGLKAGLNPDERERRLVQQAASAVGLDAFLNRKPTALSGGQKQRVALARCLLRDKPILLLDEPFSSLDPALRLEMLDLLDKLCEEKQLTMLIVTHQPKELKGRIDRMLTVEHGQLLIRRNITY